MAVMCVALAVGLIGTAVVQGHNSPNDEVKVRFISPVRTIQNVAFVHDVRQHATALPAARTPKLLMVTEAAPPAPAETVAASIAVAPETTTLIARPRTIEMEVTAYCPCTKCCGKNAQGITASGKRVSYNNGKFVAADTKVLPFGKKLLIPGYASDAPVEVIDRGGAIKGNKLDVYFSTHKEALKWGRQRLTVVVIE